MDPMGEVVVPAGLSYEDPDPDRARLEAHLERLGAENATLRLELERLRAHAASCPNCPPVPELSGEVVPGMSELSPE